MTKRSGWIQIYLSPDDWDVVVDALVCCADDADSDAEMWKGRKREHTYRAAAEEFRRLVSDISEQCEVA